jgi:hypothetical protein
MASIKVSLLTAHASNPDFYTNGLEEFEEFSSQVWLTAYPHHSSNDSSQQASNHGLEDIEHHHLKEYPDCSICSE